MKHDTPRKFNFQLFFVPLVLLSYSANGAEILGSRIQETLTPRLQSTSGAGVASLLIDESTILNPAPLAFYNQSTLYYHYNKTGYEFNNEQINSGMVEPDDDKGMSVIASDTQNKIKGSFNYTWLDHDQSKRKRFAFASAFPISKTSSFGVTYRYTKDRIWDYEKKELGPKEKYQQATFGVYHMVAPYLSLGMVVVDPFKAHAHDTQVIAGAQLSYKDMIVVMADFGGDYSDDMGETFLYRAGLQLKVFSDFLLRFGMHKDNGLDEKGSSVGLAWIGPRLQINAAMRNIEIEENKLLNQREEKIKEASVSLSVHF